MGQPRGFCEWSFECARAEARRNCESRVLSFSILITNSRLRVLNLCVFYMVCVSAFCAQLGFACGMLLGVLHAVVIEKLGTLGAIVNSLIFHMS